MQILKKPIIENCVWKVSDFKDENEWTYHFSEDEILELENSANQIINKLNITKFTKSSLVPVSGINLNNYYLSNKHKYSKIYHSLLLLFCIKHLLFYNNLKNNKYYLMYLKYCNLLKIKMNMFQY